MGLEEAGIGAGASIIGAGLSAIGASDANSANAIQAQANRDFQERMSNTAYVRATRDMKAAGLNPALAYPQGGATTPSGAMATMQNVGAAATQGASSAVQTIAQIQQMNQTQSQIANIDADTIKKAVEAANIKQATSASKTSQSIIKPESTEMQMIQNLYQQHPTLAKIKSMFDWLTGGIRQGANTGEDLGKAASSLAE